MKRIAAAVAAAALATAACGGSGVSAALVDVEARWLCDVPRFAFEDADGAERFLDELLAEASLSRTEYDIFKDAADDDPEFTAAVAAAYADTCGEL
jgi:hypothetical protein